MLEDFEWRDYAACTLVSPEEQDFFFSNEPAEVARAQTICMTCPVTEECLSYALATRQPVGIYGMHTEKDRRTLKRFMSLKPAEAEAYWIRSFEKIELRVSGLKMNLDTPKHPL